MNDAEAAMARTQRLFARNAIPASDFDKDRYAFMAAKATYARAKAELERILAGTWKEDIEVARAAAQLGPEPGRFHHDQPGAADHPALAPMDGEFLQLNFRLGQYAAFAWKEPMVVLGDIHRLHVRVDIDENDLPYFSVGAEAVATLKGRPRVRFPLKVVYVEPYVVPKQSLTGYNSERVDTRVLQVICRRFRGTARSTSTSASRWTSISRQSRPLARGSWNSAGATASSRSRKSRAIAAARGRPPDTRPIRLSRGPTAWCRPLHTLPPDSIHCHTLRLAMYGVDNIYRDRLQSLHPEWP